MEAKVLYRPWFDDAKKKSLLDRFLEGNGFMTASYGVPLYVLVSKVDFMQLFPDMAEVSAAEHSKLPGLKIEHTIMVQKDTFFFVYADEKEY